MGGIHPHDIGTILDREGVAVRDDQHCAHPLMERFGVPATVRASFGLYNTRADIDALCAGLQRVREIFGRSEEHTSELQSLMRISYAVFCLKKKKKQNT